MTDSREKYQVNFPLNNGQAFEIVTMMPLSAIKSEIENARAEGRWAKFDALNPFDDSYVAVEIDPSMMTGLIHRKWIRPVPQRGAAPPVPQLM